MPFSFVWEPLACSAASKIAENDVKLEENLSGPQHHSDVKSGVVAVMGSPEQTGTVNMIPTTRKLAGIMGRLQFKTAAYSDYAQCRSSFR